MEINIVFAIEKVLKGELFVSHVPSQLQVVDIPSKPLSATRFKELSSKLNLCSVGFKSPLSLMGHVRDRG